MNKVVEQKDGKEGVKQQDNNDAEENKQQAQEQHLSQSAQAYKLFSEGKQPVEAAIALNLREPEATTIKKKTIILLSNR